MPKLINLKILLKYNFQLMNFVHGIKMTIFFENIYLIFTLKLQNRVLYHFLPPYDSFKIAKVAKYDRNGNFLLNKQLQFITLHSVLSRIRKKERKMADLYLGS